MALERAPFVPVLRRELHKKLDDGKGAPAFQGRNALNQYPLPLVFEGKTELRRTPVVAGVDNGR
jgi:hypothetical protein